MSKKVLSLLFYFLIIFIFSSAVLLRLWRLSELFHYTYDEEVFSFVGKRMFANRHIPLIGGVTPFHVHLAPYFYWFSGIALYLFKYTPVGWGYVAAAISGITVLLLVYYSNLIFGKKVSLLAGLLYAFSFFQNIFDRHYWGLAFNGLWGIITLICLHYILKGSKWWWIVLSVNLSFAFHTDPSTLVLFILVLISLIRFRPKINIRFFTISISIFILSFTPLVLFDLRHNFVNVLGFKQYFQEIQSGKKGLVQRNFVDTLLFVPESISRLIFVFGDRDLAQQYSYCKKYAVGKLKSVPPIFAISIVILFIVFTRMRFKKLEEKRGHEIISFSIFSVYVGICIYGLIFKGDLFDHYLSTLFPYVYIIFAIIAVRLVKVEYLLPIVGIFIQIQMYQLLTAHHRYGYADKISAVKQAIDFSGKDVFSLDVIGSCFSYNGYRYLFYIAGKEPVKSYVDQNFSYLFDVQPAQFHPQKHIVITNPDWEETSDYMREYAALQKKVLKKNKIGEIEIFLIDNSGLDFVGKY